MSFQNLGLSHGDIEALRKFVGLIRKLDEAGILDYLIEFLEPDLIEKLMKLATHPGIPKLIENIDKLAILLDKLDYNHIDLLVIFLNSAGEAFSKKPRPRGLFGTVLSLRDKDAKRGVGILIELLKTLGQKL